MTGQISDSKINEVRERTDIVELISQYVSLKRSGANHMGLCPFHSEKSPSFSVNAARQFFHCFGCGVGGDVFSFLMKTEGMTFPDAARRLAERAGIDLEERALTPEEEQLQQQRERFFRINEVAADYFHQLLMDHPAGEPARDYMRVRGYGRKAAQEYQIGYSSDSWEDLKQHLEDQGLQAEDARTLGLVRPGKQNRGDYDLFRGRLIFPIYDLSGRVVAFAGRVLDDGKPKYINSPESPVYHKGRVLFGLFQARQAMRQSGEVLLVEGYFDQLALHRAGIPQVVATCGTALTVDHARILKRYVQRVVLLFDQDDAGKKATFKAMGVLQEEGVPASVIELPNGEDPDSFIQKYGAEAFSKKLAQARPVMDVFMRDALAGTASVEDRVRAAEKILEQISGLNSDLEQDLYLKELATLSGIELGLLKQKQQGLRQSVKRSSHSATPLPEEYPQPVVPGHQMGVPDVASVQKPTSWSRAEETLLSLLAHNHMAREKFIAAGGPELLDHQNAVTIARLLLDNTADSEPDLEALKCRLDPALEQPFQRLLSCDQEQFSENIDEFLSGCLTAIKRTQKKQQRENMLVQMRQFEQAGETEKAKDLLEEFKNLK